MNPHWLFLQIALTALAACGGRESSGSAAEADTQRVLARHDTVQEPGHNIMSIYHDRKGDYWFGSWEDGVYRYDGNTVLHFTTESGLPHDRVEDIQEDPQGNIYFNTGGGLCRFDGMEFSALHPKESNEWKLEPGDLWFRSLQFDGSVYRYDGSNLHKLQFPKSALGEAWVAKHPAHPNPYGIYTIYRDSRGNVWFGTAVLGACRYDGASFDWISEEDVAELHDGPSNGVRSIIEDGEGYFWFNSAYRYGVFDWSPVLGQPFYRREKSIGNLDGNPDSGFCEYMSIARDQHDALWIATYRAGVWRCDKTGVTHYPVQAGGEDITLFRIYRDGQGVLWLGTHENGVYRFNGSSFERFRP
jgi:hypothetical protein